MTPWHFVYCPARGFRHYKTFESVMFHGDLDEPIVPDRLGRGDAPPTIYVERSLKPWPAVCDTGGRMIVREDVAEQLRESSIAQFAPIVIARLIDHAFSGRDEDYRPYWGVPQSVFKAFPNVVGTEPSKLFALRAVIKDDRRYLGNGLRFSAGGLAMNPRASVPESDDVLVAAESDFERFGVIKAMGGFLLHPSIASIILPHIEECPFFFHDVITPEVMR